jgi:hypothetical protein
LPVGVGGMADRNGDGREEYGEGGNDGGEKDDREKIFGVGHLDEAVVGCCVLWEWVLADSIRGKGWVRTLLGGH